MRNYVFLATFYICLFTSLTCAINGNMGGLTQDGSAENPYLIEDFNDFQAFCDDPNYWAVGVNTRLDCNLDLDPNLPNREVYSHAPIANDIDTSIYWWYFEGIAYGGCFDGNNHIINNLTIDGSAYIALFGETDPNSQIKNLGMENTSIASSYDYIGGLVGNNRGNLSGCYSSGQVDGHYKTGGLVGNNSGIISNCDSSSTITGNGSVGGLVGENYFGNIRKCHSSGAVVVSSGSQVGGMVGINDSGSISNCYSSSTVSGLGDKVGGFVGRNDEGSISNCYSTGTATGDDWIGGLVGYNDDGNITSCYSNSSATGDRFVGCLVGINTGSVNNCYSNASADGNIDVGGLVGHNYYGSISNCYCYGTATGDNWAGALAGKNRYGSINNCFWNIETFDMDLAYTDESGESPDYVYTPVYSTEGIAEGKTTQQMQTASTFTDAWDFVGESANGTSQIWQMPQNGGYPELTVFTDYMPITLSGDGSSENPYQISTAEELGTIYHYDCGACYELTDNIDVNGTIWSTAVIDSFSGKFEGNGYSVFNLTIEGGGGLGLFGYVISNGEIKNLGVENASITAIGNYVASLVSYNYGNINNCYSNGCVAGNRYAACLVGINFGNIGNCYSNGSVNGSGTRTGGLAGYSKGIIRNSYSNCSVDSSGDRVGGLVGEIYYRNISNCYSTGEVNGSKYVGGLIGYNGYNSNINNCYSIGGVHGSTYVGGLVGWNDNIISNSFWDKEASGRSNGVGANSSEGVTGLNTQYMQTISTFTNAGWDFSDGDGDGADWMMLRETEDYPRLSWQEVYSGDIAGLYGVNFIDFVEFASAWQTSLGDVSYNDECDLEDDDMIGFDDLAVIIDNWLEGL